MALRVVRFGRWIAFLAACLLAAIWVAKAPGVARAGASQPTFVQVATGHSSSVSSLAVTPGSNVTVGNRLVVEVGVWSEAAATAASVTDSAGNSYVELLHFKASDNTEMSIWTAPITAGAGTRPTITVKPSAKADVGVVALEYAGLSTVAGASVVDQSAFATGTTSAAGTCLLRRDPADDGGQRARARLLPRLGLRRRARRRLGLHHARRRLAGRKHRAARAGCCRRDRRDARPDFQHRRQDHVADLDGRPQGRRIRSPDSTGGADRASVATAGTRPRP